MWLLSNPSYPDIAASFTIRGQITQTNHGAPALWVLACQPSSALFRATFIGCGCNKPSGKRTLRRGLRRRGVKNYSELGCQRTFYATDALLGQNGIVTFIPTFILFKSLNILGTYALLIVPAFLGNAFYIFMMRQFFQGLPVELVDAARVDGASEFRIFWQIMLPLVQAALLVMAVFTFLGAWHDFFGPLVYLSDQKQYPLSLGLFAFRAQRTTEWSLMMAASTLVTLPLIVVFFFAQRYFLEGIRMTGIKG